MRSIKLNYFKFYLVLSLIIVVAPPSLATDKVNLKADRVKYYRAEEFVEAFGNAYLKTDELEMWANKMEIDLKAKQLIATGKVKTKDDGSEFVSKRVEYDIKADSGIFIESDGIIIDDQTDGPLYVKSSKTDYTKDKSKLEDNEVTSCDDENPHHKFRATSMTIYPDDKIIAYNVTLWEFGSNVPIFYTPIYIYSLKGSNLKLQMGYNDTRGWFLKGTYNYYLDNNYETLLIKGLEGEFGQLYLDYFTKTGWAAGFKHYYKTLKDDHAYLYTYFEQDKRNPEVSPWITLELDRELEYNKGKNSRSYNLEYKNHFSNYWENSEEGTYLDYNFEQNLTLDNWKNKVDLDYTKDETYDNNISVDTSLNKVNNDSKDTFSTKFNYNLKEKIDETKPLKKDYNFNLDYKHFFVAKKKKDDIIILDFDYEHQEKDDNQSKELKDDYGTIVQYKGNFKREELKDDKLDLKLKYDKEDKKNWSNNNNLWGKYQLEIKEYQRYLTDDLYLNYSLDYKYYQYDDYDQQDDSGENFEYLTKMKLGEKKRIYDWSIGTELKERDINISDINDSLEETEYYNLPELKLTFHPGAIWNNNLIKPLDLSLGGENRYNYRWKDEQYPIKKHGYYRLDYDDNWRMNSRNVLNYDESYQYDIYSTGQNRNTYESEVILNTDILKNWKNKIRHDYRKTRGEVMKGFKEAKDDENKLKWQLNWKKNSIDRKKTSSFEIKTAYDFLASEEEKYDPLDSKLNYFLKDNYNIESNIRYDLNEKRYEWVKTSLVIDYSDFEYELGLDFEYNDDTERLEGVWDNKLDWKFGKKDWEWIITLDSSYNLEEEEITKGNLSIEKMLHCRKIKLSYDQVKKETWFQYQILAFSGKDFKFGYQEENGIKFGGELGDVMEDAKEDED